MIRSGAAGWSARRVAATRATLEAALARFDAAAHRAHDPVSLVHRYANPRDREVAAFLAASLSYGRIAMILRNAEDALARLGPSPGEAVRNAGDRELARRFAGFRHRFNGGTDVAALLSVAGAALRKHGSLEAWFARDGGSGAATIEESLVRVARDVRAADLSAFVGAKQPPRGHSFWFLAPSPESGSACKRSCMFFRWMVRRGDGVDLGAWRAFRPAQLVVPLDTHVARISFALGLTRRRTTGWRTALEVTRSLSAFDRDDPLRYDFALCHLGVTGASPVRRANQSASRLPFKPSALVAAAEESSRRARDRQAAGRRTSSALVASLGTRLHI